MVALVPSSDSSLFSCRFSDHYLQIIIKLLFLLFILTSQFASLGERWGGYLILGGGYV